MIQFDLRIFFRWVGSTSIHSLNFPGVNKVPCIQGLFDVTKPTFHQAHPQDPGPLAGVFVKSDLNLCHYLPAFSQAGNTTYLMLSLKQTNPSNATIIQNIQNCFFSFSRRVVFQPPNFLNFGCDNDMTYTMFTTKHRIQRMATA